MKKIILLLTTAMLLYVSSSALEPVRIGLNYPTGAAFRVQLRDYSNPASPVQIFPLLPNTFFVRNLTPNSSGVVSFVVGEGDPDWGGILPSNVNSNVVIDVKVGPNLVAQFNLLDMITNQATTGNGNILNDGFSSSGGVTFSDTTNLTNDFIFGSTKLDRLSNVAETKFFFDHSKSAFRAGVVNTNSWNEANLGVSSFAAGSDTKASGVGAVAFGIGTSAPSYGEVAIGSYNTTYTPGSATAPDTNDRAFVIGNGTSATPSNAFIIKKNGNMTVGGSLTVLGATITNSNLNVGGTSIDPNTGNLIVAGTTTLNGNVTVTGAKTLTVGTGLTSLGGALTVTGAVTLPANAIQDSEVDNNITIDAGTVDNTPVGAGGASTGAFTTLSASGLTSANAGLTVTGTVTLPANAIQDSEVDNNITIDGGTVDNTPVGASGASTGAFTTLSASGLTTLNDDVTIAAGKSLTVGTTITATTGDITATAGNINGVKGTFTGDVAGVKGTFTGDVSGVKGTFTGDVSGVAGAFTGDVSGVKGTFTGDVSGVAGAFTGDVSGVKGTFTGDVAGVKGTFTGDVSGAAGTFSGLTSANAGLTVTAANLTVGTTSIDPTTGNTTVGGLLTQGFITVANQPDLLTLTANVIDYTDNVDVASVDLPAISGAILYVHCTQAIASFLGQAITADQVVTVANFGGTWKIVSIN